MRLKEAITLWSALPANASLFASCRRSVRSVLLTPHGDTELETLTESFCRSLFASCGEPMERMVQAASILVHVLRWCSQQGLCPAPSFSYEIASAGESTAEKDKQKEKQAAPHRVPHKRPVCQISPLTYEVIHTFDSCSDASRALGVTNLVRAVNNLTHAGGYYWQHPEDMDTFVQRLQAKKAEHVVRSCSLPLESVSDEGLIAELRRRGWHGKLTLTSDITL